MKRLLGFITVIGLTIGLAGCSLFNAGGKKDEKKEPAPSSKLVGRIASVSNDRKFVMIQSYGSWNVPAGSILTSQGPEKRVANLRYSGEKLGQYAAADIQSGMPERGDAVFTGPEVPSKPGEAPSAKPPEGFTPSFNSGVTSESPLPQVP